MAAIRQDATNNENGCQYQPLLSIETDHIIPDELHLLLRVMDILLRNVINSAIGSDNHHTHGHGSDDVTKGPMITKLIKAINDCGVRFALIKRSKGKLDWISLVAPDKLEVLKKLPEFFQDCQPPDIADTVKRLRKV